MLYFIIILSLFGIYFGAELLVTGSTLIAKKYNISNFITGAIIVGIGTSMPEFVTSLIGTLNGNYDIAVGNVVGSNIFNILGILGITAIIAPVVISKNNIKFDVPFCIEISFLLYFLVHNFFWNDLNKIDRYDGWVLLFLFTSYMWFSIAIKGEEAEDVHIECKTWPNVLKIIFGLSILIFFCKLFVDKSVILAKDFGVSDATISLTLIACGTSLPELAASIVAAIKKNTQLALGNIIGSNIFNITFILGICSQFSTLSSPGITKFDYIVMILAACVPYACYKMMKINRFVGFLMLCSFIAYTIYLLNV